MRCVKSSSLFPMYTVIYIFNSQSLIKNLVYSIKFMSYNQKSLVSKIEIHFIVYFFTFVKNKIILSKKGMETLFKQFYEKIYLEYFSLTMS